MTGLIWEIQRVHYPMFLALRDLSKADFQSWMMFHTSHITPIVGPVMIFEAASALWLVLYPPKAFPLWLAFVNLALVGLIFMATVLWSIPNHHALREGGFQEGVIHQLVNGNWVRTIAWSLRLLLLGGWSMWQLRWSS
jgi:hypothetical protein